MGRTHPLDGDAGQAVVTLEDGRRIVVSADLLQEQEDGSYRLATPVNAIPEVGPEEQAVIAVMQEELDISKRMVETERGVRIHKGVTEREQEVVQLLYREQLDVQTVPINQFVQHPPPVRYEGTTMVVPLCEEVLVVEKRLLLKEELRVARKEGQVRHAERVVLRTEHAIIERFGEQEQGGGPVRGTPAGRRAR